MLCTCRGARVCTWGEGAEVGRAWEAPLVWVGGRRVGGADGGEGMLPVALAVLMLLLSDCARAMACRYGTCGGRGQGQ